MESPLEKDRYVTTLEFSGAYVDDMRGMYKASFKYKNGTESWVCNNTQREQCKVLLSFVRGKLIDSKVCIRAKKPIRPAAHYAGLCSEATGWDASPLQGRPPALNWPLYTYTAGWREAHESSLSCPKTQHNVPGLLDPETRALKNTGWHTAILLLPAGLL